MKKCSKCNTLKATSEFYKDKSSPTGLEYRCKTCAKLKSTKWYQAVAETCEFKTKRKAYKASYYQENKERVLEKTKEYRKTNKKWKYETDKAWRLANPDKCKTYTRRYRAKNPNRVRLWYATRRADLLKRTPSYANINKIEEFYKNCPPGMEVDHIIPLRGKNVSGFHIETNLQYLPKQDNRRKSNKFGEDK
jgi:hypothetical protein